MPDGATGIFVLLLVAAGCGGLIAVYWPWIAGGGADESALADRVGALETQMGQIATGQAPKAAAASFKDVQDKLAALQGRVDADEARLSAVEQSGGGSASADLTPLKSALDKNGSDIAALAGRVATLEQSGSAAQAAANASALAALRTDFDAQKTATSDALAMLDARAAQLEKTAPPADLAQRLDSFALKSGLAALEMRIGRLENQRHRRARQACGVRACARRSGACEPGCGAIRQRARRAGTAGAGLARDDGAEKICAERRAG